MSKLSSVGIPEFGSGTNVSRGSNSGGSDTGDWDVRVKKKKELYFKSLVYSKKNMQFGSKHMWEAQKWETGLPETQMQMAKKRKQLYFCEVTFLKITYMLCSSRYRRLRCRRLQYGTLGCQRLEMNCIISQLCILKYVQVGYRYHHQPVTSFVLESQKRNIRTSC